MPHHYPLNPFRITYGYCNFCMTTGAGAVAAAAGRSSEHLSHQELYGTLGVTSTSSRYADFLSRSNRQHNRL